MESLYSGMSVGFGFLLLFSVFSFILILIQNYRKRMFPHSQSVKVIDLANYIAEERKDHRAEIKWPVLIEMPEMKIRTETKNLDYCGAFIKCSKPLKPGKQFRLIIEPPSNGFISLKSEVVWTNANIPEEQVVIRGMGVRFVQNNEEDLALLKSALEDYPVPSKKVSIHKTKAAFI